MRFNFWNLAEMDFINCSIKQGCLLLDFFFLRDLWGLNFSYGGIKIIKAYYFVLFLSLYFAHIYNDLWENLIFI